MSRKLNLGSSPLGKSFEEELAARLGSIQDFIAEQLALRERECEQLRRELAAFRPQSGASDGGRDCHDVEKVLSPSSATGRLHELSAEALYSDPMDLDEFGVEALVTDVGFPTTSEETMASKTHKTSVAREDALSEATEKTGSKESGTKPDNLLDKILMTAKDELSRSEKEADANWLGLMDSYKTLPFIDDYLEPAAGILIIIYTLLAWPSTDYSPDWIGWDWIDFAFTVIFTLEILIKLYLLGPQRFFCQGFNCFDTIIVSVSFVGVTVQLSFAGHGSEEAAGLIAIIVARLVCFGRILLLLRFKPFKQLDVMIEGLVSGSGTLVWAFVLLFFPIYLISLLLTQFVGRSNEFTDQPTYEEAFGTVLRSMFTSCRCVFGDCSFTDGNPIVPNLIEAYGLGIGLVYAVAMMFITLGVFNLIMATFVDHAATVERKHTMARKMARLSDSKRLARLVGSLVRRILEIKHRHSVMGSNSLRRPGSQDFGQFDFSAAVRQNISKDEFDVMIKDAEVQRLLEDLDVNEGDREELFDVLDADGSGTMDMQELISGMIKLRGDPRRSDIVNAALILRHLQKCILHLPTKKFVAMEMKRVCDAHHQTELRHKRS